MNDITRRELLKGAIAVAGYAGVHSMGIGAVKDAQALGLLPAVAGFNTDLFTVWGDLDLKILFTSTVPASNEVGVSETGLITGVDLVATQNAGVPGSVDGISRVLNGTDQYFHLTTAAVDAVLATAGEQLTIAIGVSNIVDDPADSFWWFADGDSSDHTNIRLEEGGADTLQIQVKETPGVVDEVKTTNTITYGSDDVTLVMSWADASNNMWSGFIHNYTKLPTDRVRDFITNDTKQSGIKGGFNGQTFAGLKRICSGVGQMSCNLHWLVLHSSSLIT